MTMIVAHRLPSLVSADSIVVLQDGQVVQQGTYQGLLATPGLYQAPYSQMSD